MHYLITGGFIVGDGTNFTTLVTRGNYSSFAVSGADVTSTTQSLTDITGLVSGTLSNSTAYEVESNALCRYIINNNWNTICNYWWFR